MPTSRPAPLARPAAAVLLVVVAAATACSTTTAPPSTPTGTNAPASGTSLGHGAGSAPDTVAPRSAAAITSFDFPPSITCAGPAEVNVRATYATTGATSVSFIVDGLQVAGSAPLSGSFDVPVRCDGTAKTVVLVAVDAEGRPALGAKALGTDTRPAGD